MSVSASVSSSPSLTVRVPATSANLGAGFDALGVALSLYNRFHFQVCAPGRFPCIDATGEGADELHGQDDVLVLEAARALAASVGQKLPPLSLHIESQIPLQRGLGSSATAIVAGIVAANRILDLNASPEHLLRVATELERHPDNVTPALRGGFQIAVSSDTDTGSVAALPVALAPDLLTRLRAVVCIPEMRLGTQSARAVLPVSLPFGDAAFGVGRAALLVAALGAGRTDLLRMAMEDRLHQPYRGSLIAGFDAALHAACQAGAYGASLSGSGSTLLALVPQGAQEAVGSAMTQALQHAGTRCHWLGLEIDSQGAVIE